MSNQNPISNLAMQFAKGKAVHAYVVEGEKTEIPSLLKGCAKIALCPNHVGDGCATCVKVDKEEHADWIKLPQQLDGKNVLNVNSINYLIEESVKRPVDSGEIRVFTLDATESLAPSVASIWQNRLLKTLEEPVSNVYVFIGVTNADSLLQTILSRCQVLGKEFATFDEVMTALDEFGYKKDICQVAGCLSWGNVTVAKKILSDVSYGDALCFAESILTEITSTKNALAVLSQVAKRKDVFDKLFPCMELLLNQSVVARVAPQLLKLSEKKQVLEKISQNYSVQACNVCVELLNKAQSNVDKGVTFVVELDNVIVRMMEVRYRCRV